jgi:hypothetical protein
MATVIAAQAQEPELEQAALEVGTQLTLDEAGNAATTFLGMGQKGLNGLLDGLIEDRLLWAAALGMG